MPDSRLYQLIKHLRDNGVDVVPGLEWHRFNGWRITEGPDRMAEFISPESARPRIVVWCIDDAISRVGHADVTNTDLYMHLCKLAHARGVAVPEEMRKEEA